MGLKLAAGTSPRDLLMTVAGGAYIRVPSFSVQTWLPFCFPIDSLFDSLPTS